MNLEFLRGISSPWSWVKLLPACRPEPESPICLPPAVQCKPLGCAGLTQPCVRGLFASPCAKLFRKVGMNTRSFRRNVLSSLDCLHNFKDFRLDQIRSSGGIDVFEIVCFCLQQETCGLSLSKAQWFYSDLMQVEFSHLTPNKQVLEKSFDMNIKHTQRKNIH